MKLHFERPHQLDIAELRKRVDARIAHYAAKYPHVPIHEFYRWRDERTAVGSYKGSEGTVQLGDGNVQIELHLPFFARPFKGRIEEFVKRECDEVLA